MRCVTIDAVKGVLQVTLLIVFNVLFGRPSIHQYLNKHVRVIIRQTATGGIQAPAITIAALEPTTKNGLKENGTGSRNSVTFIQDQCGDAQEIT